MSATLTAGIVPPNPQLMALSDVESSELVEAVVALDMSTSPAAPKRPLAAPMQVAEEIDSGYASKSSTPENSNFGPFIVTKTPLMSLTRQKKSKLMHFEKLIPKLTQNRFEDLRELYADSLNNLASGIPKRRGILMTLKVLGESEETAEPWVFIQCDKAIAKKVRRFFKQSSVVSDFKPPSPNKYTPKLEVYVHELPPLLLGEKSLRPLIPTFTSLNPFDGLELYYEQNPNMPQSLCGSKLHAVVNGQWRSATIGGLISVETADGHVQVFGITAGHFLDAEQYTEDSDESAQEEEEETDGDTDDELSDAGQDFELDQVLMEEPASKNSAYEIAGPSNTSDIRRNFIGCVFWTSQKDLQGRSDLDWTLFTIRNNALKLPNIVVTDKVTQISTERVEDIRRIVLWTSSHGKISGYLSGSWSYLALSFGNSLVRTKAVKFENNQVLAPGDSGAWVVDSASNQLYGHVVASDMFGVSYIVPACDIFRDIQLRLSSKAVTLPASIQKTPSLAEAVHMPPCNNTTSEYDDYPPSPRLMIATNVDVTNEAIALVQAKSNVVPERGVPLDHDAESTKSQVVVDRALHNMPINSMVTTFQVPRKPVTLQEGSASTTHDTINRKAPIYKDSILVRVLKKLGILTRRSAAAEP